VGSGPSGTLVSVSSVLVHYRPRLPRRADLKLELRCADEYRRPSGDLLSGGQAGLSSPRNLAGRHDASVCDSGSRAEALPRPQTANQDALTGQRHDLPSVCPLCAPNSRHCDLLCIVCNSLDTGGRAAWTQEERSQREGQGFESP
jgi:hypothetical protein